MFASVKNDEVLARFGQHDGDLHLLVATQVLGRGLDINTIRYVINFDMPRKLVEYIHRIGRTGRAGEKGTSWSLMQDNDLILCKDLRTCLTEAQQSVPGFVENACREFGKVVEKFHAYLAEQRTKRE